ncbi:MAG: hypothetical protein JO110_05510 [Acetobacteraceae bacterium]|nr:hypothetical protein [Acetobacteraceae bacterium]
MPEKTPEPGGCIRSTRIDLAVVVAVPSGPEFPVLDAIGEVRVAFELVLSRFVDRRAIGWLSFAAERRFPDGRGGMSFRRRYPH